MTVVVIGSGNNQRYASLLILLTDSFWFVVSMDIQELKVTIKKKRANWYMFDGCGSILQVYRFSALKLWEVFKILLPF